MKKQPFFWHLGIRSNVLHDAWDDDNFIDDVYIINKTVHHHSCYSHPNRSSHCFYQNTRQAWGKHRHGDRGTKWNINEQIIEKQYILKVFKDSGAERRRNTHEGRRNWVW